MYDCSLEGNADKVVFFEQLYILIIFVFVMRLELFYIGFLL